MKHSKIKIACICIALAFSLQCAFASTAFAGDVGVGGSGREVISIIDNTYRNETSVNVNEPDEYYINGTKVEKSETGFYASDYAPCEKDAASWEVTNTSMTTTDRVKVIYTGFSDVLTSIGYTSVSDGILIGEEGSEEKPSGHIVQENHYDRTENYTVEHHLTNIYTLTVKEVAQDESATPTDKPETVEPSEEPTDNAVDSAKPTKDSRQDSNQQKKADKAANAEQKKAKAAKTLPETRDSSELALCMSLLLIGALGIGTKAALKVKAAK